jgi:hypothetical protein
MTRRQETTYRCVCGRQAPVTRGASPYEFEVSCECGRTYTLSWKHSEPPPQFGDTRKPERSEGRWSEPQRMIMVTVEKEVREELCLLCPRCVHRGSHRPKGTGHALRP